MPTQLQYIIIRCLFFIGIFVVIVSFLNARLEAMYPNHSKYQYHELLRSTQPADVVILGSSTAVYGYVPAILETVDGNQCEFKRIFNFGFMGAQASYYLEWYRLLFKRYYQQPSLIIVSLDWFSGSKQSSNAPLRKELALAYDSRYLPWNVVLSLLWKANSQEQVRILMNMVRIMHAGPDIRYFFTPRNEPTISGYDRGYMPLDREIDLTATHDSEFSMSDTFLDDLSDLLDEIQGDGSKVILVQMPVYNPEDIKNLNEGKILEDLARFRNIPYLDYNSELVSSLNSDPSLFADWSHLNRKGSHVFTNKFRNDVLRLIEQKNDACL